MTRERTTLTEEERADLTTGYTTWDGFEDVCTTIERIVTTRVAEAHRADAALWSTAIGNLEALAKKWEQMGRSAVYGYSASTNHTHPTAVKAALLRAARDLRAILRGES